MRNTLKFQGNTLFPQGSFVQLASKVLEVPPPGPFGEGEGKPVGKVTAEMFKHIGGGIFVFKSNESVRLDLNKPGREAEDTLKKHGLWTQNIGGFYYALRRKAELLRKRTY